LNDINNKSDSYQT